MRSGVFYARKRPAKTAEPATTDRRRLGPARTARSTRWARHPKDTGATPQHSGQNAPKPLQARHRSSATCADTAQNMPSPPKPATHTESPRKHAPKRNGTRPDTSFTGAVRVERGAGIDTEALEKEPGFLMAPQLRKMLRPPRPESHCGPLQDTACKNMPPTDGRTPGKDAAASNGGGRQNAPPMITAAREDVITTMYRIPDCRCRPIPDTACKDTLPNRRQDSRVAATSNRVTAARQEVVVHNAPLPNSRQGCHAPHHPAMMRNRLSPRPQTPQNTP